MAIHPKRSFIALATNDFDGIVTFYQNLLGEQPQPYAPQRYAEFQLGDLSLAIFPPKPKHQAE